MNSQLGDLFDADPVVTFLQQLCKALYSDTRWICYDSVLRCWSGRYYREVPDAAEYPRVWRYCNSYKSLDRQGNTIYPYATPSYVRQALEWQKLSCMVTTDQVNPAGLNCLNGVLIIKWEQNQPVPELIPHSPDRYFITEPVFEYNPDADDTYYRQLSQCLDLPEWECLEQTLAASLDIETIRAKTGRSVRGGLLFGLGQNGKDTVRAVITELFGSLRVTSCAIIAFREYDHGRKFPLYALRYCRVNWASENSPNCKIDEIQSLKNFITGDPFPLEGKGKDEVLYVPTGIALFNINEPPQLQAGLDAIASRWAVYNFNKTFKRNPDPNKGELQANSRFKDDRDFICKYLVPAMLNHLIQALGKIVTEGINYDVLDGNLEQLRLEASHLNEFAADIELVEDSSASIEANKLWGALERWYEDEGILTIEHLGANKKPRRTWLDPKRKTDSYVKGANQLPSRLRQLFPKLTWKKDATTRRLFLHGIYCPSLSSKTGYSDFQPPSDKEEVPSECLRGDYEVPSGSPDQDSVRSQFEGRSKPVRSHQTPMVETFEATVPSFENQRSTANNKNGHDQSRNRLIVGDCVWLSYGKGQASVIDPAEYPELGQQPKPDMVPVRPANSGQPEWYPSAWVRRAS